MISKKFIFYFKLSITAVCFGFLALLCIPLTNANGGVASQIGMYTVAGIFWGSLILEQVFLRKCKKERGFAEKHVRRGRKGKESNPHKKRLFQTKEAAIAAAAFLLAALATALLVFFQIQAAWAVVLSVGILFLSFNLYFVFNGKNYQYMKLYKGEE